MDDRYNKELVDFYTKGIHVHISHVLLVSSLTKHMANFTKFGAGGVYDYEPVGVADIDAEFIRIPKYECIEWYKRSILSFLAKAVLRDNKEELYRMRKSKTDKGLFVDAVSSEDILSDYQVASAIKTLHFDFTDKDFDLVKQNMERMDKMAQNTVDGKAVLNQIGLSINYLKNTQLLNQSTTNALMDKKSIQRSQLLFKSANSSIEYIQDIQINKLDVNLLVFDKFLFTSRQILCQAIEKLIKGKEPEETIIRDIIGQICNFSRIDKIEIADEILDTFANKTQNKECKTILKSFHHLTEGIEQYQHGMWLDSANSFNKLFEKIDYCIPIIDRLRIMERAWYCTIVSYASKEAYIPVNALNYIYESASIPEDVDGYYYMQQFERKLNLQKASNKEMCHTLTNLIKSFKNYNDSYKLGNLLVTNPTPQVMFSKLHFPQYFRHACYTSCEYRRNDQSPNEPNHRMV
jgi:hypothetical protein